MTNLLSTVALAAALSAFSILHVTTLAAQKPGVSPTCMTLLTADELSKAVVAGFKDMGGRERSAGETECPWMLRGGADGFKTVSVQFYDLANIKASNMTPDKFFDQLLSATEGVSGGKKREVPGSDPPSSGRSRLSRLALVWFELGDIPRMLGQDSAMKFERRAELFIEPTDVSPDCVERSAKGFSKEPDLASHVLDRSSFFRRRRF